MKNQRNQRILLMTTSRRSIRAEVDGWDPIEGGWPFEPDANPTFPLSSEFLANKEVGLIGGSRGFHGYKTPLHAILDGWRLMAPPVTLVGIRLEYEWWFEKLLRL